MERNYYGYTPWCLVPFVIENKSIAIRTGLRRQKNMFRNEWCQDVSVPLKIIPRAAFTSYQVLRWIIWVARCSFNHMYMHSKVSHILVPFLPSFLTPQCSAFSQLRNGKIPLTFHNPPIFHNCRIFHYPLWLNLASQTLRTLLIPSNHAHTLVPAP
jgi:hypothetical protein